MKHFIPYGRQEVTSADVSAVIEVLKSDFLTQGPTVPAFEEAITKTFGVKYGISVNSATSALHIACLALDLGPGDVLWTTPTTFVASANCARYCGADVDFVDIDPKTGLMSIEALAEKFQEAERVGRLPKLVVPVHLCGTSCDMKSISEIADRYGSKLIEDASHAVGGRYMDYSVGSCQYSSITIFSFHPVKIITTGEGGMATTNDPLLARRMKRLRSHGITKDSGEFEQPAAGPWSYEQQDLGYNYRMTDIQAALGISQFNRLEEIIAERRRLISSYERLLAELPVSLLDVPEDVKSAHHLAVFRLNNQASEKHLEVFKGMREAGIGVQLHYSPVHLQPYYRKRGFAEGDFPCAENYAQSAMSLPLYPGLTERDQVYVAKQLSLLL